MSALIEGNYRYWLSRHNLGADAKPERVHEFVEMARRLKVTLKCLAVTKSGQPRHPLYLKKNLVPVPWV